MSAAYVDSALAALEAPGTKTAVPIRQLLLHGEISTFTGETPAIYESREFTDWSDHHRQPYPVKGGIAGRIQGRGYSMD